MSVNVIVNEKQLKRAPAGKDPTARALIGSFFRICQYNYNTGRMSHSAPSLKIFRLITTGRKCSSAYP